MAQNTVTLAPVGYPADDGIKSTGYGTSVIGSTAGTLIPAVPGKRLFIHAITFTQSVSGGGAFVDLTPAGATVNILSGSSSSTGALNSGVPIVLPYSQYPWFTLGAGDAFGFWFTGGGTIFVAGSAMYVQA